MSYGKLIEVFMPGRTAPLVIDAYTPESTARLVGEYQRLGYRVEVCDQARNPFAVDADAATAA